MSEWRIINPFKLASKYQAQTKQVESTALPFASPNAFLPGLMMDALHFIKPPNSLSPLSPPPPSSQGWALASSGRPAQWSLSIPGWATSASRGPLNFPRGLWALGVWPMKLFCSRYSCRIILAHVGYVFRAVVRIGVHLLGDVNTKGSTEGVIAPLLIFESQMVVVIEILQRSVVLFLFGHL